MKQMIVVHIKFRSFLHLPCEMKNLEAQLKNMHSGYPVHPSYTYTYSLMHLYDIELWFVFLFDYNSSYYCPIQIIWALFLFIKRQNIFQSGSLKQNRGEGRFFKHFCSVKKYAVYRNHSSIFLGCLEFNVADVQFIFPRISFIVLERKRGWLRVRRCPASPFHGSFYFFFFSWERDASQNIKKQSGRHPSCSFDLKNPAGH